MQPDPAKNVNRDNQPSSPEPLESREKREKSFSRRALLLAGAGAAMGIAALSASTARADHTDSGTYGSSGHSDIYTDHSDEATPPNTHADGYIDVSHDDYYDHYDTHGDTSHQDSSHTDHTDHSDVRYQDHNDQVYVDHDDVHIDHSDSVHDDVYHSDYMNPHEDVHDDSPHVDSHEDSGPGHLDHMDVVYQDSP